MKNVNTYPQAGNSISRETLLLIGNAAIDAKSFRFARQAVSLWLGNYPGDLGVALLLARTLVGEGKIADAEIILKKICHLDPEFREAQVEYSRVLEKHADNGEFSNTFACIKALGGSAPEHLSIPEWGNLLWYATQALLAGNLEDSERYIYSILGKNLDTPLPAIVHIRMVDKRDDEKNTLQLANLYHSRWPDCLVFSLYQADAQIRLGEEINPLDVLHQCVTNDSTGQVIKRLWGEDHPYKSLWLQNLEVDFNIPIPADVTALLGWNRLGAGETKPSPSVASESVYQPEQERKIGNNVINNTLSQDQTAVPEVVYFDEVLDGIQGSNQISRQEELNKSEINNPLDLTENLKPIREAFVRLSKKYHRPDIGRMDGRFPMYIIFSTKNGLIKQYGQQTTSIIDLELRQLTESIRKIHGWGAMVYYPDDVNVVLSLGLKLIETIDPWQLKLALVDLDKALAKKGAMIGAVLIIGGPEVVPFHHLPNPTEDLDHDVLSDNPYSTLDSNYFVPEWPIGRLPGEAGPDAGLLLDQLRRINQNHKSDTQFNSWWRQLLIMFQGLSKVAKKAFKSKLPDSIGYTASVWRRSSLAVFRPLGPGESVLVSPPVSSGNVNPDLFTGTMMGYYNLHGLPDTPEWYGQKDVGDPESVPEYPVALSPKDLSKNGHAPDVVFSEACYGGFIVNKSEGQAISLRFLNIGAKVVVASTGIAYGSVTTPLIGGDLLGYLFWKNVQGGLTTGEALLKAKIEFVQEMNKRQGFLDGEDQKTLLSFVLYGDPLLRQKDTQTVQKGLIRSRNRMHIKTVSDHDDDTFNPIFVSNKVIKEVKDIVSTYLPGLDDAEMVIRNEHSMETDCEESVSGKTAHEESEDVDRVVVTFTKKVVSARNIHRHYARATLDKNGKLVKLAVSR